MFLNDIKYNWIGDIPKNWEVKRIKNLFYLKKEVSENPEQEQVLSLTMNGIIKRDVSSNEGQLPDTYKGYTKIYPDDIVMNPMDLRSGWIDRSKYNGIISPSYYVLNKLNNNLDIQFFTYQLQRHYKEKIFFSFGQGVSYDYRWGLGRETILNFPIVVPPKETQTQIVSFLDTKTQKIDELIEKTEQKIKLLKEKRTSLINHCVTKGLNPNVEMKDSGVEWIGKIPKDWLSIPLKYFLEKNKESIRTGPFGSSLKSSDMIESGIRIYNQRTVYDEDFSSGKIFVSEEKYQTMKSFSVLNGDILISSRGTIGKMTIVPKGSDIGVLHPCLIRLRVDSNKINKKFLWWYMNHSSLFLQSVQFESNSTTIDVIYSNVLTEIKFPIPPYYEQQQIVDYLDTKIQKVDSTIEKETQRIELLKEYRQSLISEVVTGKIDVRDWNK